MTFGRVIGEKECVKGRGVGIHRNGCCISIGGFLGIGEESIYEGSPPELIMQTVLE